MKKKLDTCYDALSNFLETKREIFPRFYFISDTDLLEILGQAQNPSVIQTHLKKLFQGIHRVQFSNQQPPEIVATISAAGEVMQLAQPVAVVDSVENWLNSLTNEMRFTLSKLLEEALQKVSLLSKKNTLDSYLEYVKHFPSQILSLAEMISFTNNCEEDIKNGTLSTLSHTLKTRLSLFSQLASQLTASGHLKNNEKNDPNNPYKLTQSEHALIDLKIKSLIFDIIHCIDITQQLQRNKNYENGRVGTG